MFILHKLSSVMLYRPQFLEYGVSPNETYLVYMDTLLSSQNTDSTILQSDCGDDNLRLVEGPSTNEGKVEICMNGFWGTVCSYRFGVADARVVCRQLGFQAHGMFSGYSQFSRLHSYFITPIW